MDRANKAGNILGLSNDQLKQVLQVGSNYSFANMEPILKYVERLNHLECIAEQVPYSIRPFMATYVTVGLNGCKSLFEVLKADDINYASVLDAIGEIRDIVEGGEY